MATLPSSFFLLQQEGYLISSSLTSGLTALRAAHVHNKGAFYTSLFNLSIGIERLLKAIVIMDHMLNNDLTVPTKKELQSRGHNIIDLYDECERVGSSRDSSIVSRLNFDSIDDAILSLFSEFARATRYHNLDALSKSNNSRDPLAELHSIFNAILKNDVPQRQKNKIQTTTKNISNQIDDIASTIMYGLDQKELTTYQAISIPALHDQVTKYAILRIINLLSPIRDLISNISHEAYHHGPVPPFPQMQEFLEWLWNDRQYVLRKKIWP